MAWPSPLTSTTTVFGSTLFLSKIVSFCGNCCIDSLTLLNKKTYEVTSSSQFWSLLLDIKHQSTISSCFRRAALYCYRELNDPSPNVNRSCLASSIRVCLLPGGFTSSEFVTLLRRLYRERELIRNQSPGKLCLLNSCDSNERKELYGVVDRFMEHLQFIPENQGSTKQFVIGGRSGNNCTFWLCSSDEHGSSVKGSLHCNTATCYDIAPTGAAIGTMDGAIKVWNFTRYSNGWEPLQRAKHLPATVKVNHRSGLSFLTSRNSTRVHQVAFDHREENCSKIASSSLQGDLAVWDLSHGSLVLTVPADRIHQSHLKSHTTDKGITALTLFRNRVVCGTVGGFIRVFDLRSGKLTHRLAAHPEHVVAMRTLGGVMWSGGKEGSVRWWGGRSAKVLPKSGLCAGSVTCLEMDENVVVAGYSEQGFDAWDIRTQHTLCSFSNYAHGGIKSLQFDSTKLITVSTTGKAAVWEWNSPHPVYWMPPLENNSKYISSHFSGRNLAFGTSTGNVLIYRL